MMEPLLNVEKLSKFYRNIKACDRVSFNLYLSLIHHLNGACGILRSNVFKIDSILVPPTRQIELHNIPNIDVVVTSKSYVELYN